MLLILISELVYLTVEVHAKEGSPVRYWNGDVKEDASSWENASIPFTATFSFELLETTRTSAKLMGIGIRRRCYHEHFTDADNKKANSHVIEFTTPNVTEFAVLKPFQDHLVTIEFNTKWHHLSSGNYSHLVKGIKENDVFKIEFETTPNSSETHRGCNTDQEYYIAPIEWCKYNLAKIPAILTNDTCKLPFSVQIDQYIYMWTKDTEKVADYNSKCIDNRLMLYEEYKKDFEERFPQSFYFPCSKKFKKNLKNCTDDFTLNTGISNGKGFVKKVVLGSNHATIDVNMTIDMSHWTANFPETFANSYYVCNYQQTKLKIYFHMKPEVIVQVLEGERSWWMVIILFAIPSSIVIMSVVLAILTCSFKSFDMNIWYYNNYKRQKRKEAKRSNTFEEYKKRHIEYILEMVALKPTILFVHDLVDDTTEEAK